MYSIFLYSNKSHKKSLNNTFSLIPFAFISTISYIFAASNIPFEKQGGLSYKEEGREQAQRTSGNHHHPVRKVPKPDPGISGDYN